MESDYTISKIIFIYLCFMFDNMYTCLFGYLFYLLYFMLMYFDFFYKFGNLEPSLFAYNFTCMFDYLKAGCSVFAILLGWYQQNECLLTLKHVRLVTCLLSCFYTSSNIKLLKRINWLQTRLRVCLHVCMFACLYVCMLVCLL